MAKNITSAQNVVSLSVANAELRKLAGLTRYGAGLRKLVEDVVRVSMVNWEVDPVNMLILSLIRVYGKNGVYVGTIFSDAVAKKIVLTSKGMALEEFMSPSTPAEISWNILLLWIGGRSGGLPWIELIMPKGTPEEIFASLLKEKTIPTKVEECYDIIDTDKSHFQVGRFIAHNCGYGMGDVKFRATCAAWGIPIDEALAKKTVEAYRSTHTPVVAMWYDYERSAVNTVRTGEDTRSGKVLWHMDHSTLLCRLPSGRDLTYNDAEIQWVETPWGDKKEAVTFMGLKKVQGQTTTKWSRQSTYGGKLVENVTQAVARDILANALLRAEKAGYPVSFHVHDEAVAETTMGASLEKYCEILEEVPSWAQGCPIKVEGWKGTRYKKA